jgi:hypothetical protein
MFSGFIGPQIRPGSFCAQEGVRCTTSTGSIPSERNRSYAASRAMMTATVAAGSGGQSGTLTIAGQTVTITQAAAGGIAAAFRMFDPTISPNPTTECRITSPFASTTCPSPPPSGLRSIPVRHGFAFLIATKSK